MENHEKRPLGRTRIEISPVGLGCWQFSCGKGMVGGYWRILDPDTVRSIVAASLKGGITWFDTAQAYGKGESERMLSNALQELQVDPDTIRIATKWWGVGKFAGNMRRNIVARYNALNPYPVDLYQIHQPYSFSSPRAEGRVMAELLHAGQIQAAGVSNFSRQRMEYFVEELANHQQVLASNQMRFSLLDRRIETDGVLDFAREQGITIIAYSPLAQGILTGKFHDQPDLIQSRPGPRRFVHWFKEKGLKKTRPLIDCLRDIGQRYSVTPAQVSLNWTIHSHGDCVVVIPGASSIQQAEENAGAMDFHLTDSEWKDIDEQSRNILE